MKKTLLCVLAGVAVIGSANAGIKETCLEHPDKLVWVEKTQRCIPINPCKSDDESIKKAYCMNDYSLANYYKLPEGNTLSSAEVVNIYANYLGLDCKVSENNISKDDWLYVPCKGRDYLVFEFNDHLENNVTDIFCGLINAHASTNYGGHATRCGDTSSESCNIIKKLIGDRIKVEYKQARNPEFWLCYIGEDGENTVDGFMWTNSIDAKKR